MSYREEYNENASVTSMNKKVNNILGSDVKGFIELKRTNKNGQNKKIGCFTTGLQGSSIRDAITGVYNYKHKVGSFDQDLYFSVIIATGETSSREPIILYYESPEQYEKHFFLELDKQTKDKWAEKNLIARKKKELVDEPVRYSQSTKLLTSWQ